MVSNITGSTRNAVAVRAHPSENEPVLSESEPRGNAQNWLITTPNPRYLVDFPPISAPRAAVRDPGTFQQILAGEFGFIVNESETCVGLAAHHVFDRVGVEIVDYHKG
jgi:hypothetical protein